ncbi:MAG TPA: transglycosylase SLT domain-containing protein [Acidobacteriota bacterium]|nr:transglycosylase SLT domain-containing protein [Acidobacteriota bacterium]
MNRSLAGPAFIVLYALFAPARALPQSEPVAVAAAPGSIEAGKRAGEVNSNPFNDPDIPQGILDIMNSSQLKYQEGSKLIKAGESAKARAAFDSALDLLLHSDYDLNSTPVLNRFFQDLIHRIQQDESRYLRPPDESEDQSEGAVVDELDKLDLIPIKVDPSLQDAVAADLESTSYDIPVVLNDKVLKSLNFWLNKGRKYFVDGFTRSGRYRDMIERIFREESIPLDIMYLAQVESLFKTNALSRAQAKGIWQFERDTARNYGLKVNGYVDERSDPEKSTRAAARYLRDLYAMFKDWNLVLAAYNWGEGKVQRLMERSGLKDFWEITELRRRNFPAETKNHVPLIMASIILAHNPEKYGLPKELEPPQAYEQVPVSKAIDLRAAARILNITLEDLKQLNPALRGLSTPPDYASFQLKVPTGITGPDSLQKIAELPAVKFKPQPQDAGRYRIRAGDTLYAIAARNNLTVAQILRANKGITPKPLQVGKWIYIPGSSASQTSTRLRSMRIPSARLNTSLSHPSIESKKTKGRQAGSGKGTSASRPGVPAAKPKPEEVKKPQGAIASR